MRAPVRLMPRYFTEVYRGVLCREQCIAMNRLHDHLLNSSFPCPIYYMHILYSVLLYCCIARRQRFECHCEMCCANNLIIHINTLKRKYHHFELSSLAVAEVVISSSFSLSTVDIFVTEDISVSHLLIVDTHLRDINDRNDRNLDQVYAWGTSLACPEGQDTAPLFKIGPKLYFGRCFPTPFCNTQLITRTSLSVCLSVYLSNLTDSEGEQWVQAGQVLFRDS